MLKNRSWKTTLMGLLAIACTAAEHYPDPRVQVAARTAMPILISLGLMAARDNNRRSDEVLGPPK